MVSSFYSSNQQKQKLYLKDRLKEEYNEEKQQQIVDEEIRRELGLEERASDLSKLASRIVNKLGAQVLPKDTKVDFTPKQMSPIELLTSSIKNGTLSDLFEKIKGLSNDVLNKKQRLIRDDLSDLETKSIINELIADDVAKGKTPDEIRKTVVEALGGDENKEMVYDMINKANKIIKGEVKSRASKVKNAEEAKQWIKDAYDEISNFEEKINSSSTKPKQKKNYALKVDYRKRKIAEYEKEFKITPRIVDEEETFYDTS